MTISMKKNMDNPVFITGNAAAGTTLVRNLLDGHDELMVFPVEMNLRAFICDDGSLKNDFDLDDFLSTGPTTGVFSLRLQKAELDSGLRDYHDIDFEAFKEQVRSNWDGKSAKSLQVEVVRSFQEHSFYCNASPGYWVEKTHGNEQFINIFFDWYPHAKIIHVVRDPFDNFSSYRTKSEKKGGIVTPVTFAVQWSSSLQNVLTMQEEKPGQIMIVKYEDLLSEPEFQINKICTFLNIPYSVKLTIPTTYGVVWSGNSQAGTHFSGISQKPIGAHKKIQLSGYEISALNFALAPYRSFFHFHYPEKLGSVIKKSSFWELMVLLSVRTRTYKAARKNYRYIINWLSRLTD